MAGKVAIVTGANKGIGLSIVRGLCKHFKNTDVYLTARNESLGLQAVEVLNKEGLFSKFHQLDITNKSSIEDFKDYIQKSDGGIDILVNNAGVSSIINKCLPFPEDADLMMDVNYYGTLDLCNELFPLLKTGARVVHVSTTNSTEVMRLCSDKRLKLLLSAKTVNDVNALMKIFVDSAKDGSYADTGWPSDTTLKSYGVTKTGLTLITAIQQEELDRNTSKICEIFRIKYSI